MQWRKHVRIKYGGRVGVGQGQREREQVQLQVRVVQLQREGGARLSYVCHQPQLSSTARRSCSAAAMLCCGRRKVSAVERAHTAGARGPRARAPVAVNGDGGTTEIPKAAANPPLEEDLRSLSEGRISFSPAVRVARSRNVSETTKRSLRGASERFSRSTQRKYRQGELSLRKFVGVLDRGLDLSPDKRDGSEPNQNAPEIGAGLAPRVIVRYGSRVRVLQWLR